MNYLEQFPNNVNITVTKNDLIDFFNACLSKYENRLEKQYPEHLDINQLSQYLNYSVPSIYKMVGQSEIPYYKPSSKLLFKKTEIDDWLIDFKQPTIKERISEIDSKVK